MRDRLEEPLLPSRGGRAEAELSSRRRDPLFSWLGDVLRSSGDVERTLPSLPTSLRPSACREGLLGAAYSTAKTPWYTLLWHTRTCVPAATWAVLVGQRGALDVISLSGPVILQHMIDDPANGYVGLLFVLTFVVKAFVDSQHSFLRGQTKLQIQCGLQSTVFASAIRSTSPEKRQAQNLIAIDCERASNLALGLLDISSMICQLVGILVLLYLSLSWTCLVAMGLMVLLLPLNHVVMRAIARSSKDLLDAKDTRSSVLDMMVTSIRYVKASGLESWVREKIQVARSKELEALTVIKLADAMCVFLWAWMGLGLAAVTFAVFWMTGEEFRADVAFPVIALFQLVLLPLNALPWVLNGIAEAFVSARRVDAFLEATSVGGDDDTPAPCEDDVLFEACDVMIERGELQLRVRDRLQVRRGELLVVQGGAGKSSLLLFFLRWRQMRTEGRVHVSRSATFAYVGQNPFVMPASARENVLFGSVYEPRRYARVLRSTRLEGFDDARILASGEHAVSGGEAVRIGIARALYSDSSVLLVDDVLGSLDWKTRSHIVKAFLDEVREHGRAVVIVTRTAELIRAAHALLRIEDFVVLQEESVREDRERGEDGGEGVAHDDALDTRDVERPVSEASTSPPAPPSPVSFASYSFYFSQQRSWMLLTLASMVVMQASKNGSDLLLAWATTTPAVAHDTPGPESSSFMPTYLMVVAVCSLATLVRSFAFAFGGLKAAAAVHHEVMGRVIDWPFALHASTPAGDISNRMVVDVATVDDSLPFIINIGLAQGFGLVGLVVVLLISVGDEAPVLLLALLVLSIWYFTTQKRYVRVSRELKRLEAKRRTPMHELVHTATSGSARDHVFAFDRADFFCDKFDGALESYIHALYVSSALSSWLALRLQLMASFVAAAIVALGALEAASTTPASSAPSSSMQGLAIAYILPLTGLLAGLVASTSEIEREFVSVERLHELSAYTSSATLQCPVDVPDVTPTLMDGPLRLVHVHVRYCGRELYALRDVTLHVPPGQLTVIVGASGAGKSTMLSILLGLLPLTFGDIWFGSVHINQLSRRKLQRSVGYLPQKPVLFANVSLRENLDPRGHHTTEQLKQALDATGLGHLDLDDKAELTATSLIFLSLARLVLLRPRVLLLDEPSSCLSHRELDAFTDMLSNAFDTNGPTTILETAHALERALKADLVVVLADGAVAEVGPPADLLAAPSMNGPSLSSLLAHR